MVSSRNGLRLDSNFTEDSVGLAIQCLLTIIGFPHFRFSIEPFSRKKERWLGADARLVADRIEGFRPFYMQFKRPSAYPDHSQSKIIKDRKRLKLTADPKSIFFRLRAKHRNHREFQHNILHRLQRRLEKYGLGAAAYVCPLFLDREAYSSHIRNSGLLGLARFWHYRPFDLEELLVHDNGNVISFERIPILAEHISIPAHDLVTSSNHKYSFSEAGSDVCFHSPKSLPEGSTSLALFLKETSRGFLRGEDQIKMDTASELLDSIKDVWDRTIDDSWDSEEERSDDPISQWLTWGETLRQEFGIEQFAFVQWKDEL